MTNPKISILLPVYNGKKYLHYSLKSILLQTYDNFEILITDDGSSDHSSQYIIETFSDDRIKIFVQENKGKNSALNNSLSNSSGDYITIFDQDDYFNKYYLENVASSIIKTSADCILTRAEVVYDYCLKFHEMNIEYHDNSLFDVIDYHKAISLYLSDKSISIYLWNKIFKREIFNDFQFNSRLILDDISSTHLLMSLCKSFTVSNGSIYFHCVQLNSLSSKNSSVMYLEQLASIYMDRYNHFQPDLIDYQNFKILSEETILTLSSIYLKLLIKDSHKDNLLRTQNHLVKHSDDFNGKSNVIITLIFKCMLDENFNLKNTLLKHILKIFFFIIKLIRIIQRTTHYYLRKFFSPC